MWSFRTVQATNTTQPVRAMGMCLAACLWVEGTQKIVAYRALPVKRWLAGIAWVSGGNARKGLNSEPQKYLREGFWSSILGNTIHFCFH